MTKQLVPDKTTLRRYLRKGLTQKQVAEEWERESGFRVTRSAIGMAMARYNLTGRRQRGRYEDLIPWYVLPEHRESADAKVLRLEGRRRRGKPLNERDATRLANWRRDLLAQDAVVHYDPETEQGWWWVPRRPTDDDIIRYPPKSKRKR